MFDHRQDPAAGFFSTNDGSRLTSSALMLRVVTGSFRPGLESALVRQIQRTKARDPLAAIGIFAPSFSLLDRLRRLVAIEHGLSLLNVHFLTFHQLALRLADERCPDPGAAPLPEVVDTLFFERLVRHLVRRGLPRLEPLHHIGHSAGTWSALWATIRDLKDAGVDARVALRGLDEGCFDADDAPWLRALFSLHGAVEDVGRSLRVGTQEDLTGSVIPLVPSSAFLGSLGELCYYGFYDLTQVQLSFFEAVARALPTTLFFPLGHDARDAFARRFFDRYVRPLLLRSDDVIHLEETTQENSRPCGYPTDVSVRSVVGPEEELASCCRLILELVETKGYRFDEIGVVGRTLDPYLTWLRGVFDRHRIPFRSSAGRPLLHEPLCKALLKLASLPLNEGYRPAMLDVVTSPLYRHESSIQARAQVRPDLWRVAVQELHIIRGRDEWARLEQAVRSGMMLHEQEEDESSGGAASIGISSDVLQGLWSIVSRLLADCASVPVAGSVVDFVETFRGLAHRHFNRPEEPDALESDRVGASLHLVWEAVDCVLASLSQLEPLGDEMSWTEFVDLLSHAMQRASIPMDPKDHQGVSVLDAMTARGVPFKVLFILGLNQQQFPRYIREDAFLRDRHRRILEATLGFKIDEKLTGYDEEALLFSLLCRAATERLFLSFQRADDEGRPLAPSPYLADTRRDSLTEDGPVEIVPRRLSERVGARTTLRAFLPLDDLAVWAAMHDQDAGPLMALVGQDPVMFHAGRKVLEQIEDEQPILSGFDGITGRLEPHWTRLLQRGVSPSAMERYARCPFQYFCADVLHAAPRRSGTKQEVDPGLLGTLCHAALRRCYIDLLSTGWPEVPLADNRLSSCIEAAVEGGAAECEVHHHTGHYLLWQLAKELVRELIRAMVGEEGAADSRDNFVPFAFEVEAEGTLPPRSVDEPPVKIRGRVDRLDRHHTTGRIRVVDYKVKVGASMRPEDRDLVQSAVRGVRLQPPLYSCLRFHDLPDPTEVLFVYLASKWSPPVVRRRFDATVWSSPAGRQVRQALHVLMDGVKAGRFVMLPEAYCDDCEFRPACRRDHTASAWRSSRAAETGALTALRRTQADDGE